MRLPLDISEVPQHLPNYHTENGRVDHEYIIDRLLVEESVQRILQRQLFLKEGLLASIVRGLVLPPSALDAVCDGAVCISLCKKAT